MFKKNILNLLIGSLSWYLSFSSIADVQIDYEKALVAYQNQQFSDANLFLKNALQSEPEHLPAKVLMAKVLTEQGKYIEAKELFNQVIAKKVDFSLFIDSWAQVLIQLRLYQQIIEFQLPDTLSYEQKTKWYQSVVNACLKIKNYTCAADAYHQISIITQNPIDKLNGLANIALEQHNYDEAKVYLTESLSYQPNSAASLQLLASLEKSQGNYDVALNHLLQAHQLTPNNELILKSLADLYLAMGEKNHAQHTLAQILQQQPNDPFAILVNSQLEEQSSRPDNQGYNSKLEFLTEKLFALPNEVIDSESDLLMLRGLISFFETSYEQALRDFQTLNQKEKNNIQVVILLAKTHFALGKIMDGVNLLETYQGDLINNPKILIVLAEQYLLRGKTFKALTISDLLLAEYPNNLDVKLLMIKVMLARGKNDEGLQHLDALLVDYPASEKLLLVHSILNLQTRQYDKALSSIEKLLINHPNNANFLNTKAAIFIQTKQLNLAFQIIQDALAQNKDLLGAQYNLATIYSLQDKTREAENVLNQILSQHHLHLPSLLLLANIEVKLGKFESALKRYQSIIVIESDNVAAREGKVNIYLAEKQFRKALAELEELKRFSINNFQYILQSAYILIALNEIDKAKEEANKLTLIAKGNTVYLLALSQLQLKLVDPIGAEKSLRDILKIQPENKNVSLDLIQLLLDTQQTQAAQIQLNQISQAYPNESYILFLKGRLAEQQSKIEIAGKHYLTAIELNDSNELALAKLYHLTFRGYSADTFVHCLTEIIERYPERYFPRNLLAQYYFYRKSFNKAAIEYEILLNYKNNPNRAALLERLAQIYLTPELNEIDKSAKYAFDAYQLSPDNADILTTYGWILTQQGKANEGLGLLRKAYVLTPQNLSLRYYIAVSLSQLGLNEQAVKELEYTLSTSQKFAEQAQARDLLGKLK
ncbi:PEP-CTERM system TPR-repeat protein PrsT [Catenovulum sp. 2E275]|uniref:XrtA/PEP-CTERM system TPR-repeat protein PrsT n=1 Tax=Catenovulum sp. 2E275 TaxID=2980497 RepID=UPI0021D09A26|nr:XrtA/PEP-CTERM system TPR-repeat protein PrsT [Catenovulum sp. 2E275]MCU4674373.1 PEP-CTERM system TPR-repeat protein PrsT [Catenovulum sp. 2E275]